MPHREIVDRYQVRGAAITLGMGVSTTQQQGFSNRLVRHRTRHPNKTRAAQV
jgi:hypothetical protein